MLFYEVHCNHVAVTYTSNVELPTICLAYKCFALYLDENIIEKEECSQNIPFASNEVINCAS